MANTNTADVVIVGGGIIGCLTAYYLTRRGLKPIVIESDAIASGASGTSAGWLTPYSHTCDPAMIALSPASLWLHAELAATLPGITGIDHGYREAPYIRCAISNDGVLELREFQTQRAAEGVEMEWLSGEEALALSPWITADIVAGLRSDNEPTLDSYRLTMSAMQAAEIGGARMVTGKVTGLIEPDESGATRTAFGVLLEDGSEVRGDTVVLAMGPWCGEAAAWLDHPVPVTPQRGQIVYLAPPDERDGPELEIGMNIIEHGGSLIGKRLGDAIVAASRDSVGFDRSTTNEARNELLINAARLSDRINNAQISGQTACLRPISADGRAYVGQVPGWSNAYLATGHSGEGIHYGPVTGAAIAELIADGVTQYDIAPLSPARAGTTPV